MGSFGAEIPDHNAHIVGYLTLDVKIPRLHVRVPEVRINRQRRNAGWRSAEVCPQRRNRSRSGWWECHADGEGKRWIGSQARDDTGDGLIHLIAIAAAHNRFAIVPGIPGKAGARLEVLGVLVVNIGEPGARLNE